MANFDTVNSRYFLPKAQQEGELFKQFTFGSGENHLQILAPSNKHVEIMFRYRGDQSIIQLLLLTDALRRQGANEIDLYIPYFPGARQDRVCNQGEPLSAKVYADLINQQQYHKVYLFDPHSDVVVALLNNAQVIKNHQFIKDVVNEIDRDLILISPDAGSNKKIFELSSQLGGLPVVRADKLRDVSNGAIIGTEVFCEDLSGKTAMIVDDICAGGRTFIELAKKLKAKNCEKIILVVSHYEGSAQEIKLQESGIDAVYTTNSLQDLVATKFLNVKNIWQFMPAQGESK
ncbi:ribose-phosphate diphosphokinase [Undibacterium parvum]|uniref:Ribose-phosphate pyrophosphokinase n=2 Tax=Undibacterium TaxID=401469 RepID=A0A6M4A5H2_9BURK|nr:ribose-phosphate diphosphokinase [Undibacterium parvum]AZP10708.1 ribose-phosphate pyrophosphokinase [Undibacterium parvum]QJQ05319.1 ribose-phosphate pyrophosphokinase [Undibacterium piscinae]